MIENNRQDQKNNQKTNKIRVRKKFKSLLDLIDYIQTIESQYNSGNLDIKDIDFRPIFENISQFAKDHSLESSIKTYDEAADTFREKIKVIKEYINRITFTDLFNSFLDKYKEREDILANTLFSSWKNVVILDNLNISFLYNSYIQLSKERKKKKTLKIPAPVLVKGKFELVFDQEMFEQKLDKFYAHISPKLPAKISELLLDYKDEDERLENFILLLHLIQDHRIAYDKSKDQIIKRKQS
ncbi:MAG: hypothetical protein ACTSU2_11285 [Promethearchaeota archaeon]